MPAVQPRARPLPDARAVPAAALRLAARRAQLRARLPHLGPLRRGGRLRRRELQQHEQPGGRRLARPLPRARAALRRAVRRAPRGQRAARQGDRGDHRQQLGRQTDGERHGEHQRLQHRPAEEDVHRHDHDDEGDHTKEGEEEEEEDPEEDAKNTQDLINSIKEMTGLWDLQPADSQWIAMDRLNHETGVRDPMGQVCFR